jgi:protein tyrosine phosphatase
VFHLQEKESVIEHYYYKEWPDKSCPIEAQSIPNLINKINLKCSLFATSAPILVHCSAGIGRTGTFIAISNLVETLQDAQTLVPRRVVADIRQQRAFLVQTWQQYKFVHQAVLEWCLFSSTSLDIDSRGLCRLKTADDSVLRAEYWNIQRVW